MKTQFEYATISTGTYNTPGYNSKEYTTLAGFKRGLKSSNCPYEIDENGLFNDVEGKLKRRQWNYAGQQFTANIEVK